MIRIKKSLFLPLLMGLSVLGLLYTYLIKVEILKENDFIFTSKITQNSTFHIRTDHKLTTLSCNGQKVSLDNSKKHDYFYQGQEEITIPLVRGENRCHSEHLSAIKQKISFIDFIVLFILWGIPLFHLLFLLFILILDRLKSFKSNNLTPTIPKEPNPSTIGKRWIVGVLLLGVVIRVLYFNKYGIMTFQHDWHGHIEFIKYVATNWSLPTMPMKGWEYPQQPLYYIITGGLYGILTKMGFNDTDALHHLGYFSLLCSLIFLYYSYRFIALLTQDRWIQLVAMIFISLTPSLVYVSTRISNDSLVLALSIMAIYYTIKAYQEQFKKGFLMALVMVSLLFLTKVSASGIELLLFTLLLISYYKTEKGGEKRLKISLHLYGLMGIFLLCFTLFKLYVPLEESHFYMVNSAKFPNQTLENLDINYFFSFHIIDLIQAGKSHVFGVDSIRHSFLTYQYGTMFFGEFDYNYFIKQSEYLHLVMQIILTLGLIFPMALLLYLLNLHKEPQLHKILFAVLLINLVLILKFIISYPSICNTDFRYFVSSFTLWAFVFAKGLSYLHFNQMLKNILNGLLGILVLSELLFFYFLI